MLRRLALWGVLISAAPLVNAAPPPAEAFGHVPRITDVVINPAGTLLAWGDASSDPGKIVIHDLGSKRAIRTIPIPEKLILLELTWADDDTLLFELAYIRKLGLRDADRSVWSRTFAIDTDGKPPRLLLMKEFDREWVTGADLLAVRTGKPNVVIMATLDYSLGRSQWTYNLYEVDTNTGSGRITNMGSPQTLQWIVDSQGRAVARTDWDSRKNVFRILRVNGTDVKEIYSQADGGRLSAWAFDEERNAIIASGARGAPNVKIWSVPMDGSAPTVRFEEEGIDVDGLEIDEFTDKLTGVALGGSGSPMKWLDAELDSRHKTLARSFPNRNVVINGRTRDAKKVVVSTTSRSHPTVTYLVDFASKKADIIGEAYPALENQPLGQQSEITYDAKDGTQIPAYLTLPPGAPAERLPLIVFPHGGPEGRDYPAFDWAAQFFATRGYAVLQPQFRGSTGFGEMHRLAGYRQWGQLMQDDVTDGVKHMISTNVADPNRVCIVGMSYGGYAALAGAAFTPELYACAASVNGPSDLPEMLAFVSRSIGDDSYSLAYWREHIGSPQDPQVAARSPRRAISSIRAPVLLLHGAQDTVVPPSQSESMARAMAERGKQVTFTKLEGEDHWLSRTVTRTKMLKELETFLAQHLGPVKQ